MSTYDCGTSPIIVSDAGPLIAFFDAGAYETLLSAFDVIYVPDAVHREVFVRRHRIKPKKIKIYTISETVVLKRVVELRQRLDIGESEAMALAEHLDIPILIDERAGRRIAEEIHLKQFTTVDLLTSLIARGLLKERFATKISHAMRQSGYSLPPDAFSA